MVTVPGNGNPKRQLADNDAAALSEQTGLWIALGILITLVTIGFLFGFFNFWLANPLIQLRRLRNKELDVERLQGQVRTKDAQLITNQTKIQQLETQISTRDTTITAKNTEITALNGVRDERDTLTASLREATERMTMLQELKRTNETEIVRLTPFEAEANALRPRIGEQDDTIRGLRRDVNGKQDELSLEKKRYLDLAKKLAWWSQQKMQKSSSSTEMRDFSVQTDDVIIGLSRAPSLTDDNQEMDVLWQRLRRLRPLGWSEDEDEYEDDGWITTKAKKSATKTPLMND